MKKFIFAVFVAFWASIGTIAVMETITPSKSDSDQQHPTPEFTRDQVAAHDHLNDCWMIINDGVYDFTGFISQHPTPASILAPWCGRDATEGMQTKGIGRAHSPAAWTMMENYRLGSLADES
jgi:cytochrome b involved in lipid metabolism